MKAGKIWWIRSHFIFLMTVNESVLHIMGTRRHKNIFPILSYCRGYFILHFPVRIRYISSVHEMGWGQIFCRGLCSVFLSVVGSSHSGHGYSPVHMRYARCRFNLAIFIKGSLHSGWWSEPQKYACLKCFILHSFMKLWKLVNQQRW